MVQIRSIILAILATMSSFAAPASAEWAKVIRVVDGDTIVVRIEGSEKVEKVRYLGIDTPETVHPRKPVEPGGPEASAANRKLVDGKKVWLSRGPRNRDRHGRLLRRVSLEDGRGVVDALRSKGHAKPTAKMSTAREGVFLWVGGFPIPGPQKWIRSGSFDSFGQCQDGIEKVVNKLPGSRMAKEFKMRHLGGGLFEGKENGEKMSFVFRCLPVSNDPITRQIGRYQLVRSQDKIIVRLDTATGQMEAFVVATGSGVREAEGLKFQIIPVAEHPARK